jgi:hypothetical protein
VATNHFSAAFALPQFLLLVEKLFCSMLFDELQIAYQAHSEVGSVSSIDFFQSAAWKGLAFEAESDFALGQLRTLFLQKCAVLPSQSATYASSHFDSFCSQIVLLS